MKVYRFFHIRTPLALSFTVSGLAPMVVPERASRQGGATVLVVGDPDSPNSVEVQTAFCCKKDIYCRAEGRKVALTKPAEKISLRDLPRVLGEIEDQAMCQGSTWLRKHEEVRRGLVRNWDFSMRYFLPRN